MKIKQQNNTNQEDNWSFESSSEDDNLYVQDLIPQLDEENDELQEIINELIEEEECKSKKQQEFQQNETDEKILNQLKEYSQQYQLIIEKVSIHKQILRDLVDSEESKQIDSKDQVKYSKKSLNENYLKLEKMLLGLDNMIGASEKVRPQKKNLVNQIQKSISEIDNIKSNDLQNLENKIEMQKEKENNESTQQKPIPQQKESQMENQEEDKKMDFLREIQRILNEKIQQKSVQSNLTQQKFDQLDNHEEENEEDNILRDFQRMMSERQQQRPQHPSFTQQKQTRVQEDNNNFIRKLFENPQNTFMEEQKPRHSYLSQQPSPSQKTIKVVKINEEEEDHSFPFPSKKDWEKLSFEPEFKIKQQKDCYLLSSNIPNLDVEEIRIKIDKNILSIEGVRVPNEEEKKFLLNKLFQYLRNPYVVQQLNKQQIISLILKISSQYNFGKFSVSFQLPSNLDSSQDISATYKNDVLQVGLPIRNKNFFYQVPQKNHSRQHYPYHGYENKRSNNFWDFF